ncbi:MAG TPA: NADH-quinone oxidoreductase subunit N [Phycisphaerae bacterium]|nr:NADH-quinone oxidoreductase subunit N [Phycisphaerae bacterium]
MNTDLNQLTPEIIMLVGAGLVALMGLARQDAVRQGGQWVTLGALALAFISGLSLCDVGDKQGWTLWPLATYDTLLSAGIGILLVLSSWDMPFENDPSRTDKPYRCEFFALLLCSLAGVSMIAKVDNLIWLFLALELTSIPTYIMVAIGRGNPGAHEAGVKYFFLGALSAAIYLFGFSYLYGFAGSTDFSVIKTMFQTASSGGHISYIALIGLLTVAVGISFKIAAFPLHYYAPDVYQGAAAPVTSFLSFAPKAAGFFALIMVFNLNSWTLTMGNPVDPLSDILLLLAAMTMTLGNVLALLQRDIKRIMAYSSIAHSGYMLVGLGIGPIIATSIVNGVPQSVSSPANGISAALFYLGGYSLMTTGFFAVLIYFQGTLGAAEDLDDIAGIAAEHPLAAACMTVCLLSLIGMPFTVGFLGKLFIVQAALAGGHPLMAVIVVLNAAIAAAYYLRMIAVMYLRDAWAPFSLRNIWALKTAAVLATGLVVIFGLFPSLLLNMSANSGLAVGNYLQNNYQPPMADKPVKSAAPTKPLALSEN